MWQNLLAGFIVAAISGIVGYLIKSKLFTRERYLPETTAYNTSDSYTFINGDWLIYHFTHDPKVSDKEIIAK